MSLQNLVEEEFLDVNKKVDFEFQFFLEGKL